MEAGIAARVMKKLSPSGPGDSYVDWYEVFGLTDEEVGALGRSAEGADAEEEAGAAAFKRAFRRLAIQLHPDRCKEADAGEAFAAVRRGYDLLVGGAGGAEAGAAGAAAPRGAAAEARANRRRFHVEWLTRKSLTDEERARDEKARVAVAPTVTEAYRRNDGRGRCDVCFGAVRAAGAERRDAGLDFMSCSCPTPTPWTCGCGHRNSREDELRCAACSTAKGGRYAGQPAGAGAAAAERQAGRPDGAAAAGRTDAALAPKRAGFKRPKRRRPAPAA